VFQPVEVSPQVGGSARLVVSVASLEGDDHGEAYTAILRGVRLSHENQDVAGAEAFLSAEGNMCGAAMRGPVALPGSKATSRKKGTRRNLGDLTSPTTAEADAGRDGKSRRRSRRGSGEESDGCILPVKPRTKPTTNRWRRWWREGGRPKGRRAATHAPVTDADLTTGFGRPRKFRQ
jgi:hypothetical protein